MLNKKQETKEIIVTRDQSENGISNIDMEADITYDTILYKLLHSHFHLPCLRNKLSWDEFIYILIIHPVVLITKFYP